MKLKPFLLSALLLLITSVIQAQNLPGDAIVYGPMMSPVYNNSVRVWVLTRNNTGSGNVLSLDMSQNGTTNTPLTGTVYNSDDRLGYNLRSFEYRNLIPGQTYTAKILVNGLPSGKLSTIKNEQNTIDDFEFLSGGCGRIYDTSRCIDQPEAQFHTNGTPEIFNVMAQENSDMMVWLGDNVYLLGLQHAMGQCPNGVDDWANKDMAFQRYIFFRNFHDNLTKSMPQLAITDNHDLGPNEFNKTMPTIAEMREIFMDWWPNPEYKSTPEGQGLYSSYVYKDVEYFLLDNRSYRDGTTQHLGPDQLQWLKNGLLNSTATFKVLINGTPSFKSDLGGRNFSSTAQASDLVNFIKTNNINGVLSLSADIHQQRFMIRDGDVKYPLYDVLSGNINSDVENNTHTINYNSNTILSGGEQTYLRINVYGPVGDRRMKIEYVRETGVPYFETIIHEDILTSQNADALKLDLEISNSIVDASEFSHTVNAVNHSFDNDRKGVANEALKFTVTTSVTLPDHVSFDLNNKAFSLTFWVNPQQLGSDATIYSNAVNDQGASFGIDANGKLTYTDHARMTTYTSQNSVLPNHWSFITWKYDNVKRKLTLYYNGFLIQTWNNVLPPSAVNAGATIGNNFENKRFIGLLDKLSLYGRLISDEDIRIASDFQSTRGDVLKVSGSQNMILPSTIVNTAFSNDFTIEFWGKLNSDPGANFKILASHGRISNLTTGLSFEFADNNKLNVVAGNNTTGWNSISGQGSIWNIGEWNHVALSVTKNGTMKYYVNGQYVAEAAFGQYISNTFGLGLGFSPFYGNSSGIQGELDELRLWNRALTANEISDRLHYKLAGTEPGLVSYYDFSPYTTGGNTVMSLGSVNHEITLNGGVFETATSPVAAIPADYQNKVTGKWSRNNSANNSGLTFVNTISTYTSNAVVGKKNDATISALPASNNFYLKGGWKINPLNFPFATININLTEALVDYTSVISAVDHFYLIIEDAVSGGFTTVSQGTLNGTNVTFSDVSISDDVYYLSWSTTPVVQIPAAQFIADRVLVNEGENVVFTDQSTNTPTQWSWTFEGGNPSTSNLQNPTVTYPQAGTYNVTLVATNSAGNSQESKVDYITVEEVLGVENPLSNNVSLYPNPTNGIIAIQIKDAAAQDIQIEVIDILGRKLAVRNEQTTGTTQVITLDLAQITGEQIVFVKVKIGDKAGSFKVLKTDR